MVQDFHTRLWHQNLIGSSGKNTCIFLSQKGEVDKLGLEQCKEGQGVFGRVKITIKHIVGHFWKNRYWGGGCVGLWKGGQNLHVFIVQITLLSLHVLGGRSLDSLMAQAQTRQKARWLWVAMLLNKQPKGVLRTPELLLGPQTLHHLTWIWAKPTITSPNHLRFHLTTLSSSMTQYLLLAWKRFSRRLLGCTWTGTEAHVYYSHWVANLSVCLPCSLDWYPGSAL